jgi:hypothetical protein
LDPISDKTQALEGGTPVDSAIRKRVEKGIAAMERYRPIWHEALAFFDNDQYVEQSAVTGDLARLESRDGGTQKPRWRMRRVHNRMTSRIVGECSFLVGRIPGWEATPVNSDPRAMNGAALSEKVLLALYDSLDLSTVAYDTLIHAANCASGYSWPYWNSGVGTFIGGDDGQPVAQTGEIGVWRLRQDEVIWEDGVSFDDSSWYCVRKAQDVEKVKGQAGYIGPRELKPDAQSTLQEARQGQANKDLVFVHHYLEKPCPAYPQGRWIVYAGGKEIVAPGDWPAIDPESGAAVPVLHQVSWIRRAHRHRDLGIGELMVDLQRSYNDTCNRIEEWIKLAVNPQLLAPQGSLIDEYTTESGRVVEYRATMGLKPEWMDVREVPLSLFKQLDQILADMDEVVTSGGSSLPTDTNSASHVQALNEREESRRGLLVKDLAKWWASMGRHLLFLVQQHYDEPRLLRLQGRFGPDRVLGFRGSDIPAGIDVRVTEGSLTPQTRAAQEAKIAMFVDKGWVEPHKAMAALAGGSAQKLIDEFELDISKQYREIEEIMKVASVPAPAIHPDLPSTHAMAIIQEHVLESIPKVEDFDDHAIHMDVLKQWMKTRDFEEQPDVVKGAARAHYLQHEQADQAQQFQAAQQAAAQAQSIGQGNATKLPQPVGQPSSPSLGSQAAGLR